MTYGMSLRALLEGWVERVPDIAVAGLTSEPGRILPGHVLVSLKGWAGPGQKSIRQAAERGCVAVIHDGMGSSLGSGIPLVALPGVAERLGELAARFWAAPSDLMTIAGVTGRRGRSTITHYLAQVWQRSLGAGGIAGKVGLGPLGSLQPAGPTEPDVFRLNQALASCLDAGVDHVAIEVSPTALESGRCQTVQFDAAVFTGLGQNGFPVTRASNPDETVERRLFTDFAPRFAIFNRDDATSQHWAGELAQSMETLTYGLETGAELRGEILASSQSGTRLRFDGPWGCSEFNSSLRGQAGCSDLLAVAGTLTLLGMDWQEVVEQLEWIEPLPAAWQTTPRHSCDQCVPSLAREAAA